MVCLQRGAEASVPQAELFDKGQNTSIELLWNDSSSRLRWRRLRKQEQVGSPRTVETGTILYLLAGITERLLKSRTRAETSNNSKPQGVYS